MKYGSMLWSLFLNLSTHVDEKSAVGIKKKVLPKILIQIIYMQHTE